ncbi:MOSC domain-containing protein [Sulfitobacter mediterraneus]|uniref:MOSC domain-containing protein n=1 Tax=Sulfitobacter mediterraneus TaxID=83219 RepID=UPI00193968DF|nr:MOSC domain-containing protein [Sulfitobacter mediterraneus]MBM1557772.1 MOSC domain-containing protein [Sulfitobacter mediterraneus]MBM1568853.1 MOSC domain-containing protein [Sulfitobacter mediterraneus]MBM1572945.1 MOSC domain-containing protein [Sulfitobacter mediterraneus]MBM1576146.1 MOSC domain-containing protein [Sulfitobacter mediterraneus]MBM1580730.1 MOSC domain-containing protein [Sulfitobacter mediterraneus]
MPELIPTDHYARITWMGSVPQNRPNIRSQSIETAFASYAGIAGDYHAGLTRASCVRVTSQHPKGTEIRNVRQLSILSAEELDIIAKEIGLEAINPVHLGASLVVEGIDDFTHLPPNSRLQAENGATIVVDMQNGPCNYPAREIENDHPGHGKGFLPAARGRRGVCAWIEREGQISVGDVLRLHIPGQRAWAHK